MATIRHRIGDRVFTIPDSPILIEHLERAGDDTFQLGWTMLRICKLADGTFGIDEGRGDSWIASADQALADLAAQLQAARHLGVVDRLDYPVQDQAVMAADCALNATRVLMTRLPDDDLPGRSRGGRSIAPTRTITASATSCPCSWSRRSSDHPFLIDRKSAGRRLEPVTASGARTYSRLERYAVGELVAHPTFGLGRVTGVYGKRVETRSRPA